MDIEKLKNSINENKLVFLSENDESIMSCGSDSSCMLKCQTGCMMEGTVSNCGTSCSKNCLSGCTFAMCSSACVNACTISGTGATPLKV